MITKEQAIRLGEKGGELHCGVCRLLVGARGGLKLRCEVWRPNGKCQTWKTRPDEWRLPLKRGLRQYGAVNQSTAHCMHLESECEVSRRAEEKWAEKYRATDEEAKVAEAMEKAMEVEEE